MSEKMLTYGDIALRLNCSVKTVRRAVRDGKIKRVMRINKNVIRIPESEFEKYMKKMSINRHQ